MSDTPIDFHLLVDRYLDDALDPGEAAELSRLMETRPEVAAYFAEAAQLFALLHEHETARIEPHRQDKGSGNGETDTARMLYAESPQEPARITRGLHPQEKRSTRRSLKSISGGGARQYRVPLLVAAAALFGIALIFGLSSGGPSGPDPRTGEIARRERERTEQARRAALHREEVQLQEAREKKAQEDRVLAEKAQTEAKAQLREIEEKRRILTQTKPESQEDAVAKEKREKDLDALKRDQERIERELKDAAQLAQKTERPAPAKPPLGEKPLPPSTGPAAPSRETTQTVLAQVEEVAGEAFLVTKDGKSLVTAGANLLPGQGLETGGGTSRIVLRFPDKTRVDLGPEALLAEIKIDSGKHLALTQGTVRAVVAKQPKSEPLIFITPHGQAKVVGTTLRLYVDPDPKKGSRLEVEEGKVELRNLAGKTVYVESGHYAVAGVGVELVARKLESIPAPGPSWILDFQADFANAKPDPSVWVLNRGFVEPSGPPGVPVKHIYVDKAVECKGGSAIIHADRKGAAADSGWTSGYLGMTRKYARLYGRFEVCCKLPKGNGLESWIRLMSPDGEWPGEIPLLVVKGDSPTSGQLGASFPIGGADFSDGFHIVACEWESGSLKWYVDGELRGSASELVPKKPLAVVINLTVGGWGGLPDASTPSSAALEIKYVRVFKTK